MRKLKLLLLLFIFTSCKQYVENLDSLCDGIINYSECAQIIEKYQLKNYSNYIKRVNSKLILNLENGKELVLENNESDGMDAKIHYFREYYDSVNIFVIDIIYYEGGEYLLVNRVNGEQIYVFGKVKLSHDMKRIVSYNEDLIACYSDNGFQIIDITENHFKLEYELSPKNWGPVNVNWINNSEIEIEKYELENEFKKTMGKTYFIKKDNWIEKK
jgi:RNAse (barnase) inhibitor barstar